MGNSYRPPRSGSGAGFTVIELAIVTTILAVALLALSKTLLGSMSLTGTNRESGLARDAARDAIERLQGVEDFATVVARFNDDLADDPPDGESPGSAFDVAGLQPAPGDPDGRVGEVVFPLGPGGELWEDLVVPELGMPRDLNANGALDVGVDLLTTPDEFFLVPVLVRVRWQGEDGLRGIEVRTLLADR